MPTTDGTNVIEIVDCDLYKYLPAIPFVFIILSSFLFE